MASLEQEVKHPIVVMGDHMYKAVWDPCLGNHSTTKYERNNPDYKHTVAVLPVDLKMTERHLLKDIFGAMLPVHATRRDRRRKTVEPCGKACHSLLKSNFNCVHVCALPKN